MGGGAGVPAPKRFSAGLSSEPAAGPATAQHLNIRGVNVVFPMRPYQPQMVFMERLIQSLQEGSNALLESPTGTGKTLALLCASLAWQKAFGDAIIARQAQRGSSKYGAAAKLSYDAPRRRLPAHQGSILTMGRDAGAGSGPGDIFDSSSRGGDAGGFTLPTDGSYSYVDNGSAGRAAPASVAATPGMSKAMDPSYAVDASDGASDMVAADVGDAERVPAIIYASRTHSQLAQVVKELSRTVYNPRVVLLGSREQMCINSRVRAETGPRLSFACRALTKEGKCSFKNNVDTFLAAEGADGPIRHGRDDEGNIMDIEDFQAYGKAKAVCPYYLSRESSIQTTAQIVFVPYNYLVDPATRAGLEIPLQGSIVIFDEAHNLESVASSSSSFDLSVTDIAGAIAELDEVSTHAMNETTRDSLAASGLSAPAAEEINRLKVIFLEMEERISDTPVGTTGVTQPGDSVFRFFATWNITFKTREIIIGLLQRAADILIAMRSGSATLCLSKIVKILEGLFRDRAAMRETIEHYRVHIHALEDGRKKSRTNGRRSTSFLASGGSRSANQVVKVLSFWCFSPGVVVRELKLLGIRSLLLTSGTLSPMNAFAAELETAFPIRLENSHVISPDQVKVVALGVGPTGKRLLSTYVNRDRPEYKSELGHTVANFARVVPDGLLVFFPSYGSLESALTHWHTDGSMRRISTHKKVFVEPRASSDLNPMMVEFKKCIDAGESVDGRAGAVFFAVCRGKVSEGLDFADKYGRAVVITGLPYAPARDPKVILKRKVLDERLAQSKRADGDGVERISGHTWYNQQAARAVNQAIGRVIRHQYDYGAIILCDERFANEGQKDRLSLWLRPRIETPAKFGLAAAALVKFYRTNQARPPPPPKPSAFAIPRRRLTTTDDGVGRDDGVGDAAGAGGSDVGPAAAPKRRPAVTSRRRAESSKPSGAAVGAKSSLVAALESDAAKTSKAASSVVSPPSLSSRLLSDASSARGSQPAAATQRRRKGVGLASRDAGSLLAGAADEPPAAGASGESAVAVTDRRLPIEVERARVQSSGAGTGAGGARSQVRKSVVSDFLSLARSNLTTEQFEKLKRLMRAYKTAGMTVVAYVDLVSHATKLLKAKGLDTTQHAKLKEVFTKLLKIIPMPDKDLVLQETRRRKAMKAAAAAQARATAGNGSAAPPPEPEGEAGVPPAAKRARVT